MNIKFAFSSLLGLVSSFVPFCMQALEVEPWLPQLWEFHFKPAFSYAAYPYIQQGEPLFLNKKSRTQFLTGDLYVCPWEKVCLEAEIELAKTRQEAMNYWSFAAQGRYQLWNDLTVDPLSLTLGADIRAATSKALQDPSCPYHSYCNIEATASTGKQWGMRSWDGRAFFLLGAGIANHGAPWVIGRLQFQALQSQGHSFTLWGSTYCGFGKQKEVFLPNFHGYGSIQHRSIDATIAYSYEGSIWGKIEVQYTRRLYARSFPAQVNRWTLSYNFPFSLF